MTEDEQIKAFSQKEKRRLSRLECAWCDHSLSEAGCSAIYEQCAEEVRVERRRKALAELTTNGKLNDEHASDCATHNEPAYPNGLCDCGWTPNAKLTGGPSGPSG